MNYIGIDTSLSSTGVYIKTQNGDFYYNYKNSPKLSKWHKTLSYMTYKDYSIPEIDNYSDLEIVKLIKYNEITDMIVNDILTHCKPEECIILTEGYSYSSSNTSSLIDLIGYATLLRTKLLKYSFNDFIIKSPSTLKMETCKYTYKPIEKSIGGKNPRIEYIYKSDIGIPGGRFHKPDMLKAIFDNVNIDIQLKTSLSYHKEELLKMKAIPKPIDDIVDAIWLVYTEIFKSKK